MFERLIESSPRGKRSPREVGLAVGVHAGVILVAAAATRGAAAIPRDPPPALPFHLGVAPAAPIASPRGGDGGSTRSHPASPFAATSRPPLDIIPDVTVPGLPGTTPGRAAPSLRVPRLDGPLALQAPGGRRVEVDQPVEPIEGPRPVYPARLREAGIEGAVRLRFVVTADGVVDSTTIAVVRSSHAAFDTAAVHAVLRWRFRPARLAGRPVAQLVEQVVRFGLDRDG